MKALILILMIALAIMLAKQVFKDPEKDRKKRGLDKYRIKAREYYECGEVFSRKYYVEQLMKVPILSAWTWWEKLEEHKCGYSDCYWDTKYFESLELAEKAIAKLRLEDSTFNGPKEEIVKYIP